MIFQTEPKLSNAWNGHAISLLKLNIKGPTCLTAEVFKIEPKKVITLKEFLIQNSSTSLLPSTSNYESFRIKYLDGLIIGYTSGKIVTNTTETAQLASEAIKTLPIEGKEYNVIIGSDEAGKGEWLGPMTIAAVALTPEQSTSLIAKGVMDSKLLKLPKILELAKIIKANSLNFHIVAITPERFNRLFQEVKDEGKSLNDMLAWGHAKVIESAYNNLSAEQLSGKIKVVIDEFDRLKTESRLKRVLNLKNIILEQKIKAEEETAVAAASILARAEWEIRVDQETKRLGIDLRNLSPSEAINHPKASLFAKVNYLKKRF